MRPTAVKANRALTLLGTPEFLFLSEELETVEDGVEEVAVGVETEELKVTPWSD
jgi:hypothetical protein